MYMRLDRLLFCDLDMNWNELSVDGSVSNDVNWDHSHAYLTVDLKEHVYRLSGTRVTNTSHLRYIYMNYSFLLVVKWGQHAHTLLKSKDEYIKSSKDGCIKSLTGQSGIHEIGEAGLMSYEKHIQSCIHREKHLTVLYHRLPPQVILLTFPRGLGYHP